MTEGNGSTRNGLPVGKPPEGPATGPVIIGDSPVMREAIALSRRLATSELSILLVGATGTGKELIAQEIHRVSARKGSMVDVNCAALPRDMVEAMLFGHRRGAFTSANADAVGLIESAHRGTLFLDELQSLTMEAQPKLLRVLESGEVRRLGETHKRSVQVRTVAAAQPGIGETLRRGGFREDLLQRLAGAVIRLPTLSERAADIPLLAQHFARTAGAVPTSAALEVLLDYDWPGNVRELRRVIERATCLADGHLITGDAMRRALRTGVSLLRGERTALEPDPAATKRRLLAVFAANNWNAAATARALGLGRTTLFKELRQLGISLRALRTDAGERVAHFEREQQPGL